MQEKLKIHSLLPFTSRSSRPDLLDTLGDTHIISLELVQAVEHQHGGSVERPLGGLEGLGVFALGEVVDYTRPTVVSYTRSLPPPRNLKEHTGSRCVNA